MSLADKPVYPSPLTDIDRFKAANSGVNFPEGMTLLQHYAGLAMQGVLSSGCSPSLSGFASFEHCVAVRSVAMAKALIAELEKEAK